MGDVKISNTPYDDVFRTLLNDCSSLIIPVINEIFGENYSGKEKIIFSSNEHFLNKQGGNEEERITDTSFVILGKETKKYHLECQSNSDHSMLVRFFEYDTQVMKVRQYTIKEIFEKKLLFLIPFYIFSHEGRFREYEQDETKLRSLKKEYENIKNRLETLLEQGIINEYTRCTIIDMSNKVLEHIAQKYDSVMKGVKAVMGGKVLEYEAKTIKNEGIKEGMEKGIEKGIEKGMEKGIMGTVSILKNLGIPLQTILLKIQEQYNLSPEESQKYIC